MDSLHGLLVMLKNDGKLAKQLIVMYEFLGYSF